MTEVTVPFLRRLVGNPHAYAIQQKSGRYVPVREPLTPAVLAAHLRGEYTVGTYLVWGDRARTLVWDIDKPEELDRPEGDMEEVGPTTADLIELALADMGIGQGYTGLERSGRRGHHVWLVLSNYVKAHDLRRLGLAVLAEAGVHCEVYPKQDKQEDLGNLVKLPGGIHRMTGNRAEFVDGVLPRVFPVSVFESVLEGIPEVRVSGGGSRPPVFGCMEAIQEGVGEGGRQTALFHLAVMCRRGGLTEDNTLAVVSNANDNCDPPLDPDEVADIVHRSDRSGPLCSQLGPDVHCGESCVLERTAGLYTRPGQIRHAAEGERVVLTLKRRRAKDVVEFDHDDLKEGEGVLK